MGSALRFLLLLWGLFLMPLVMLAQNNNDCRNAIVICSDSSFSFLPSGAGMDDFANPNNDQGCLFTRETISAWFYFEFREDMPANSDLTFLIQDTLRDFQVDYDFSVYGPVVNCDSLGSPIRCSFARIPNNVRPGFALNTGLAEGETDTTETFIDANGLLRPMNVNPGEGYFLIVDMFVSFEPSGEFESFDSTRAQNFSFDWGGAAAPFLNCIANPNCDQVTVDAGRDTTICAGTTLPLRSVAVNTAGQESYRWEGTNGATAFIDDPNARETFATIPFDFAGEIVFTSTVTEGACVHADDLRVTVDPAGQPSVTGDTLICEQNSTELTAESGFATYTWSDGTTGPTFTAPGAGIYQVTVTSGSGCPGIAEVTVRNFPVPDPPIEGPPGFCPGGETELRVADGFVSQTWSTGSTAPSIIVNAPDTYSVTLVDTFGCTLERSVEVRTFTPPVPAVDGPRAICSGDVANLRAEDGYLSYEWSTSETGQEVSFDSAGTYTLEVIDSNGCRGSDDIVITERDDPVTTITGETPFCSNESGLLMATPGFVAYSWSTGDDLPAIEVTTAGPVSVTVTDQFGCRGRATINVDTFSAPRPTFDNPDFFCAGDSLRIRLQETYVGYDWSTGAMGSMIAVDQPGAYRVTVTDAEGCQGEGLINVDEIENPQPVIQGEDRLCPGEETTLSLANTYSSYQWSTGSTAPQIRVDRPDDYSVTVTDAFGCRGNGQLNLIPLSAPVVRISGLDAICAGEEATLIANAGFRAYDWSTGERSQAITVQQPGDYGVTVTDENGCQAFESVTFAVNPNPKPRIDGNLRLCEGESTTLQVQGGNFADYRWSTGDSSFNLVVREEASYAVTVTTPAGCVNADTAFVEAFRPIPSPLAGGEIALCAGETAVLDAGPGFIDYRWSTGSNAQTIEVTEGGLYGLTVLDSNICLSETEILVQEFAVQQPTIIGQAAFCSGQRSTLIAGGQFREYEWSTGQSGKSILIDTGGVYSVTVTDNNGCRSQATRNILEEESPDIDLTGPSVLCGDTASITLTVTGGYSSYLWTNNAQDTFITVDEPGRYGVLVFGSNGCATSQEIVVQQRPIPLVGIDGPRNICSNDLAVFDPGPQYQSYAWSTGDSTQTIAVNQAGIYELNVVDSFGCPGFARAQLQVRRAPDFTIEGPRNLCLGDSLDLRVGSDSLYRDYRWTTGSTESAIRVFEPGLYEVSVTATNDCVTFDSVRIQPLDSPQPQIVGDTFFCAGSFTLLEADTVYAAYQWTGGRSSPSLRISEPGRYRLTVESMDGCAGQDSVEVLEIDLPVADAGPDTLLDCYRPSVVLGGANTTRDAPRFSAIWSGPDIPDDQATQFFPSVHTGGTYRLVVQDTLYNCPQAEDEVVVADVQYEPALSIGIPDTLTCRGEEVQIPVVDVEAGESIGFQWTYLDANQRLNGGLEPMVRFGGLYQFDLLDTLTGCQSIDTIRVVANTELPNPRSSMVRSINCRQDSQILIAPQPPLGDLWAFAWEREDGTFGPTSIDSLRRTVRQPGAYRLLIEDVANGCRVIDSLLVMDERIPPDVTAGPDQELDCLVEEVQLGGPVAEARWQIRWSALENIGFSAEEAQPVVDRPGTYIVEAFDPRTGCLQIDTAVITAYENFPDSIGLAIDDVVCFGERNGQIAVTEVSGGARPLLYQLNDRPFHSNATFSNLEAGKYTLTVQDARGCELSEEVIVQPGNDVFVELGPDQFIKQGERVRIRALTSIPEGEVGELRWVQPDTLSCDTCVIQSVRPLETMQLAVFAVDTNGCRGEDLVHIFVDTRKQIYVPTAFSPDNGDGVNDVIMIYSARNVSEVRVWRIFDRWGELVFERNNFQPNDPAFGWNGLWRNALQGKRKEEDRATMMNAQVFVYYAEVEFIDGEVKQFRGDFSLIK